MYFLDILMNIWASLHDSLRFNALPCSRVSAFLRPALLCLPCSCCLADAYEELDDAEVYLQKYSPKPGKSPKMSKYLYSPNPKLNKFKGKF
jgi:hypothetical protein